MSDLFHRYNEPRCSLCGEKGLLTGEHKIKASLLDYDLDKQHRHIGSVDNFAADFRVAQGPKSKFLKFKSKICEACNTSRTQSADRQFDIYVRETVEVLESEKDIESPRFNSGTAESTDVHRYCAKILCCFLAEVGAPTPTRLSAFAIGRTDNNCVQLERGIDPTYFQILRDVGPASIPTHGGLAFGGGKKGTYFPGCCFSSFSLKFARFTFSFWFTEEEKRELLEKHPDFYKRLIEIAGENQGARME